MLPDWLLPRPSATASLSFIDSRRRATKDDCRAYFAEDTGAAAAAGAASVTSFSSIRLLMASMTLMLRIIEGASDYASRWS